MEIFVEINDIEERLTELEIIVNDHLASCLHSDLIEIVSNLQGRVAILEEK